MLMSYRIDCDALPGVRTARAVTIFEGLTFTAAGQRIRERRGCLRPVHSVAAKGKDAIKLECSVPQSAEARVDEES
jgi:hypothetical protein